MASLPNLSKFVKLAAYEAGFDLAGIAPLSSFPEMQYFRQWVKEGRAGEMRYLESRDEGGELKRLAVERMFPWARSVLVCAINYNPPAATNQLQEAGKGTGWISRYAQFQRDYHDVVMEKLRVLEGRLRQARGAAIETRCYVDTGPLLERVYAAYAGIGWVGKNTCIINQQLGSWLFLGVILTSIELDGSDPLTAAVPAPDRCGTCTRCLDACPTNAFLGPRRLDASRCISYLTIEKRGEIPETLRADVGANVFGCDICQDVCPWNRKAPASGLPAFQPRPSLVNPDLRWLANLTEEDFREAFRGSPIKRAKRSGLRRNAVVAMGNSGDPGFLPLLRELANDADAVVAGHARWAIRRLGR
jgi:epoxyqueuosine reductase